MNQNPVLCEVRDGIGHLRLNRPMVLNAIDDHSCVSLIAALDRLENDLDVHAIVLSGSGERAFCSGADVKYMRTLSGADLRRFIELTWQAFERLARSPLPSIAVLHGHVYGGGLELALACDMRVARADAIFRFPEMQLGSVPGSGALQRLPGLVGRAKAAEMILLGDSIDAGEAERIGLVNKVLADQSAAAATVGAWMKTLASRPRESIRYCKLGLMAENIRDLAPAWHGLVSDLCHRAPNYADQTARFGDPR